MSASYELTRIAITCPSCDAANLIIASDIADTQDVVCSRCHRFVGVWLDLKEEAEPLQPSSGTLA